ncbi:hypothetical protein FHS18_003266 [Paenibacillus phyllosphaerae]|uniref:Calcineurin-like phosphoesterase domain-containing protein n=1 Tax=Paenibacillus phyllosphaerae TaxID=274593 RepID=A0A7W5AYN7_9BACL|nr:metallophosphoesterase [Paenibacillus phyllosphaerae]MBB3111198.1 hypothetical protein [Paenibacillus phyllosphaerae]
MIVYFILFLLLYNAFTFYIGWSGWKWLNSIRKLSNKVKVGYAFAIAIIAYAYPLGRFGAAPLFIEVIGYYWLVLMLYGLILLPLAGVTVALMKRFTRIDSRRLVRWTGSIVAVAIAVIFTIGTYMAYSPVVRSYPITIDKPVAMGSSLRIVMAADMHFGALSNKKHAQRLVEKMNGLQPDLILLPGDIIDDSLDEFLKQGIGDDLAKLEAKYGIYASLGNHDYRGGVEELGEALAASGIQLLVDEWAPIADQLYVIGREDYSIEDRASLSEVMDGIDLAKPVLLLDHQPRELDQIAASGVDLVVSGHTHRGQLAPGSSITNRIYENDWGYLRKEALHSIVTSGFGFWGPPVRIGSRSEIAVIDVTFKPTAAASAN